MSDADTPETCHRCNGQQQERPSQLWFLHPCILLANAAISRKDKGIDCSQHKGDWIDGMIEINHCKQDVKGDWNLASLERGNAVAVLPATPLLRLAVMKFSIPILSL